MRTLLSAVAAVIGFLVAATACYLLFVEGLGWGNGVVKITAPIALFGAFLGWEAVQKGARLVFGEAKDG